MGGFLPVFALAAASFAARTPCAEYLQQDHHRRTTQPHLLSRPPPDASKLEREIARRCLPLRFGDDVPRGRWQADAPESRRAQGARRCTAKNNPFATVRFVWRTHGNPPTRQRKDPILIKFGARTLARKTGRKAD